MSLNTEARVQELKERADNAVSADELRSIIKALVEIADDLIAKDRLPLTPLRTSFGAGGELPVSYGTDEIPNEYDKH